MQNTAKQSQNAEKMTMQKRIGSTTYHIGLHFNPEATETLEQKIERILKNDLQSLPKSAKIDTLQAGLPNERSSA